jgi:hypothetical protein
MVEGQGYGALTFQGGGEGDQVSDGQGIKPKSVRASLKAKRRISVEWYDVTVTQGGEGDTTEIEGLDAARPLSFCPGR